MSNPFRYFNSSPEVIRLVVMMYVRYPLSLRNVEDLLAERGIDISYETVRFWWNRLRAIGDCRDLSGVVEPQLLEGGPHSRPARRLQHHLLAFGSGQKRKLGTQRQSRSFA